MKTPTSRGAQGGRKPVGVLAALALAAALGSLAASPAMARDDHRGHRDRGHDHDRGGFDVNLYATDPVYVPPPVYYDPTPSPGISISVPLHFGHR